MLLFNQMSLKDLRIAGRKVGKKLSHHIRTSLKNYKIPELAERYPDWVKTGMRASARRTPRACSFLLGMAEGAEQSFKDVFCLWYEELWFADTADKTKLKDTGCTDIIVRDGSRTIIGHTNDEGKGDGSELVKIIASGFPDVYMIFTRGCPSIGLNGAGIVISGNQVDAKDTCPGVPRMLLYVEALWSRSVGEAEKILLCDHRASSFNNIIANAKGDVVSLEASAKHSAKVFHDSAASAHTNHFIFLPEMEARKGASLDGSRDRLERAFKEIGDAGAHVSVKDIMLMLATHGKGGLCRHGDNSSHTVFSVVFLPTERAFIYGKGNPCSGDFSIYRY